MAITKVELIQLLRGFADNDEVECITFERNQKDMSDSFRNLPIHGVYNKTKNWELVLGNALAE